MRVLSAILATLVLFLTVQPVLINSSRTTEKSKTTTRNCCSGRQHTSSCNNRQQKDDNCCNSGHCDNPFLSCSNYCFLSCTKAELAVLHTFVQTKKVRLANDNTLASYAHNVWHPPQANYPIQA